MQITKERLDSLKATFMSEEDSFSFYFKGKHKDGDTYFYCGLDGKVSEWIQGKEDNDFKGNLDDEDFLKQIEGKELEGEFFLGYHVGEQSNVYLSDWEEYSKKMGVSKLVVLSTKVPEVIAKRFEFFADEKSSKLRQLVVEYVKKQWIEKADSLVFQSDV
jgi:hypothetical protein